MPKINPQIMVWARETAGLTQEEAAKKLGFQDSSKIFRGREACGLRKRRQRAFSPPAVEDGSPIPPAAADVLLVQTSPPGQPGRRLPHLAQ